MQCIIHADRSLQWLRKHDADSNSKISKEEFLSFSENSEAVFNIMDKNGDGIAEAREFLQTGGIGGKPTIWIKHQDTDLDGMVSEAEYLNTHAEL